MSGRDTGAGHPASHRGIPFPASPESESRSEEDLSRTAAIARQRCPRCLQGRVFRGPVAMNDACPFCGYVFGREEGYFTGAMYVSYFIGLVVVFAIIGILWRFWPTHSLGGVGALLGVASLVYLAFVPVVFRTSRVVWLHLDYVATVRRHGDRPD